MTSSYGPRELRPGEEPHLFRLYETVYGADWRRRTCVERYLTSSIGASAVSVVEEGNLLVGAQAVYDVPFWIRGEAGTASVFVDVVTHPDFRRRGIFRRLLAHALERSRARGARMALSTPNPVAYRGFQADPGWATMVTLEGRMRLLRCDRLGAASPVLPQLVRRIGGLADRGLAMLRPAAPPTNVKSSAERPALDSLQALWKRCASRTTIMQRRDAEWFEWRFGRASAGRTYHFFMATDDAGQAAGYVVGSIEERSGLRVALLVDGLCPDGRDDIRRNLIDAFSRWAYEQRTAAALTWALPRSPWACSLRERHYGRLPDFVTRRPYRVCAQIHDAPSDAAPLLSAKHWHLSLADSDLA